MGLLLYLVVPAGRPKKYKTEQQRKAAKRRSIAPQVRGRYFRLVIPNLQDYCDQPDRLLKLKGDTLNLLLMKQTNLLYYKIAVETHVTTGVPHLDIFLAYQNSVQKSLNRFDYLVKHGSLTRYRSLNAAILQYGDKEDDFVLTNMPADLSHVLQVSLFKKDPYRYLESQMQKDPLNFSLQQYVCTHNLARHVKGWSSIKIKLKDMQVAAANLQLRSRPGFKYIDDALIASSLTAEQLTLYRSWSGYQLIVDYLNQVPVYGGRRKMKTLNLLITGPTGVGKTSLFHNPNHQPYQNPVEDYVAVYPMGMTTWFPAYRTGVYKLILWNQATLTSYSYDLILKLLEGSFVDLAVKGGVAPKRDNPLIVMTSNLTLQQLIVQRFGFNQVHQQMARRTLAARVQNVIVPPRCPLFILQKLLVSSQDIRTHL